MSQQIHLKRNTFVANDEILERTQAENIDFAPWIEADCVWCPVCLMKDQSRHFYTMNLLKVQEFDRPLLKISVHIKGILRRGDDLNTDKKRSPSTWKVQLRLMSVERG